MHHWDRDTSSRLQRISTPVEQGCEISVHSDQMEPLPEEQQSQQGTPMNPTAYISMRDHIHPPRVSAPSCIIPPAEDVAVRPYLVPLLPTFHGMENENPYTHIRDFEEVCITFKEGTIDMDLLKLKAFPLILKDKAKIWLNSLRPRTIRNWAELQAEFLKKFFSDHKTNNLKRQIYTFAAHDNERFYQCWERFMETIRACPHHGFDTWMLVNHLYGGMSPAMKQLLETMCFTSQPRCFTSLFQQNSGCHKWKHSMVSRIQSIISTLTKTKWSCMGIKIRYDARLLPSH